MHDQIRVLRALATAYRDEGENATDRPATSELLCLMADTHNSAADALLAEVAAESAEISAGHRCTLDHATMPTPKCAACGAPRGK
jgi:hypothetical protein